MIPKDSIRLAYDLASAAYAQKFLDELEHKPKDRELLAKFAEEIGPGRPVLDIGCGPGHTTDYLCRLGLDAVGVDLSPEMVSLAAQKFPGSHFRVGDFTSLEQESSSIAGILAFYCIVHLSEPQLKPAFAELHRVLAAGGILMLSFHVGSEVIHAENFLESGRALDFVFFQPEIVEGALAGAGFGRPEVHVRKAYETEFPSERCYIIARKGSEVEPKVSILQTN
jgi:SAM-dependent methyltransferase